MGRTKGSKNGVRNEPPKVEYPDEVKPEKDGKGKFRGYNQGRPKFAKNKLAQGIKVKILEFVDNKVEKELDKIWIKLSDKDKCNLLIKLIQITVPEFKNETPMPTGESNGFNLTIVQPPQIEEAKIIHLPNPDDIQTND